MKTYKVLCKKKKTRYGNNRVIHTVRAISFLVGVDSGSVGVGLAVFYRGLGKKDEYISNVHSIKEETGSTEITVWTRKKKKKAPKKTKPFALAFNDDLMMAFYQGLQSTKESYDKMSESQKILAKKRLGGGGKTGYEIRETVAEWVKDSQNEALFIELYDNSTVSSTWFSVELDKARRAIELEKAGIKFGDQVLAYNGVPIRDLTKIERSISTMSITQNVEFMIKRGESTFPIVVQLGRKPIIRKKELDITQNIERKVEPGLEKYPPSQVNRVLLHKRLIQLEGRIQSLKKILTRETPK